MFRKYRSVIEPFKSDQQLKEVSTYEECVSEIVKANLNLDSSSKKYYEIIEQFPKLKIERIENITESNLTKNIVGMLNIEVSIGDRKMKFLFDTGAQISCINSKYFESSIGVSRSKSRVEVGDSTGTFSEMEIALTDKVEVLGMSIENLPMLAIKEEQLSLRLFGKTIFDIDGVLGWDVIKLVDFELDYKSLKIALLSREDKNEENNFIDSDFPVVLVSDDRDRIRKFGIDTGARKSWINEKLIKENQMNILKKRKQKIHGAHGTVKQYVYLIDEYNVAMLNHKIALKNLKTGYTMFLNNCEFDGVFGVDIAKNNIIVFLNSSGTLKFK